MKQKFDSSTETIFPVAIVILSIINLTNHLDDILSLSVLLSLIGIAGAVLWFQRNTLSTTFIYIWIIAQVITIYPIWDLTQFIKLEFGFTIGTAAGNYSLNLNVVGLIYLVLFKVLQASILVGKTVVFKEFSKDSFDDVFPLKGIIVKRFSLAGEKNWLLVNLETSFIHDNIIIRHVLIKRKDDEAIKLKSRNQIIYFRLVINENDLLSPNDSSKFPFIHWVLCQ